MDERRVRLQDNVEKAISIRFEFSYPDFTSGPVELHSALVAVGEDLGQVERLLSDCVRIKYEFDTRTKKARMVWQEAFDKSLTKKKVSFSEFSSGKEKQAEANLAAFNEARVLAHVEAESDFATSVVDLIRLHYYGLDKVRQDIRKRLDMSQTDYYS